MAYRTCDVISVPECMVRVRFGLSETRLRACDVISAQRWVAKLSNQVRPATISDDMMAGARELPIRSTHAPTAIPLAS